MKRDAIPDDEVLPDNSRGAGGNENPVIVEPSAGSASQSSSSSSSSSDPDNAKDKEIASGKRKLSSDIVAHKPTKLSETFLESLPQDSTKPEKFRSRTRSTRGKIEQARRAFSSMVQEVTRGLIVCIASNTPCQVSSSLTPASIATPQYVTREELRDLRSDMTSQLTSMQRSLNFIEAALFMEPGRFGWRASATPALSFPPAAVAAPAAPMASTQSTSASASA